MKKFLFFFLISFLGIFISCEKWGKEYDVLIKKEIMDLMENIEDEIFYKCEKDEDCPKGTECLKTKCNLETGECEKIKSEDGTFCNDGKACTVDDICIDGECKGVAFECDDYNPCTVNNCDDKTGECFFQPEKDGTLCDDDDPCTINSFCKNAKCHSNTFVYDCCWVDDDCDDSFECTYELCNKEKKLCERNVTLCSESGNSCAVNLCGMEEKCNLYDIGGYSSIYFFDLRNYIPAWLNSDPHFYEPDSELFAFLFSGDGVKVKEKNITVILPFVRLPDGNLLLKINGSGVKDCSYIDVFGNKTPLKGKCITQNNVWLFYSDITSYALKDFELRVKIKDKNTILRSAEIQSIGIKGCPPLAPNTVSHTDSVLYFHSNSYKEAIFLVGAFTSEKNAIIKWQIYDRIVKGEEKFKKLYDKFSIPESTEFKIESVAIPDIGFAFVFGGIGYQDEKNAYIVFVDEYGGIKSGPIKINPVGSAFNPAIADIGGDKILVCLSGSKINLLDKEGKGIGCVEFSYQGVKKGGIFPLNKNNTKGDQDNPEIEKIKNGILFLWESKEQNIKKVFSKILDFKFSTKKEETLLLSFDEAEISNVDALSLDKGGAFIVYDFKKESEEDVYGIIIDEDLKILKSSWIINKSTEGKQKNSEIIKGLNGIIVLWEGEGSKIFQRFFNFDGTPLGDEILINAEGFAINPSVSSTGITNALIFWKNKDLEKIQYLIKGLGCYKGEIDCVNKEPFVCNGIEYIPLGGECKGENCTKICD